MGLRPTYSRPPVRAEHAGPCRLLPAGDWTETELSRGYFWLALLVAVLTVESLGTTLFRFPAGLVIHQFLPSSSPKIPAAMPGGMAGRDRKRVMAPDVIKDPAFLKSGFGSKMRTVWCKVCKCDRPMWPATAQEFPSCRKIPGPLWLGPNVAPDSASSRWCRQGPPPLDVCPPFGSGGGPLRDHPHIPCCRAQGRAGGAGEHPGWKLGCVDELRRQKRKNHLSPVIYSLEQVPRGGGFLGGG